MDLIFLIVWGFYLIEVQILLEFEVVKTLGMPWPGGGEECSHASISSTEEDPHE